MFKKLILIFIIIFAAIIMMSGCQAQRKPLEHDRDFLMKKNINRVTPQRIQRGTIRGVVRDAASGKFIANATIRVLDRRAIEVAKTSSETNGFYKVDVASGVYTLETGADGYMPAKKSGRVNLKQMITIDFDLQRTR